MKSSSFQQAIQAQFDCLTKKVIKRAAMKYNRDISRRLKHEVPFSEISDLELNKAGVYDKFVERMRYKKTYKNNQQGRWFYNKTVCLLLCQQRLFQRGIQKTYNI